MSEYAPICFFVYKRLDETKQALEALQKNSLAKDSDLIIFSDGFKNESDREKVNAVREYIQTVSGFKSVTINSSEQNKGLATSIIDGVTKIITDRGKVIVLEDDLVVAPNFLQFMNQALFFYSEVKSVFSISGYTMNLSGLEDYEYDYYVGYRASSWGWATWEDRWMDVQWTIELPKSIFKRLKVLKNFTLILKK